MKPFRSHNPSTAITVLLALAGTAMLPQANAASAAAEQFGRWSSEQTITRRVSLSDLGITTPLILSGDSQRDLYLPVPASIAIKDASLQLNANYLRGNGGRSLMLLSIDGDPIVSSRITDDRGDVTQQLVINGLPRKGGFVRFGVAWSSVLSELECADQRAPGNILRIAPTSTLSYSIEPNAVRNLAQAWAALPIAPVLLISQRSLKAPAFDAAWRLGLVLEQAGKRVTIKALPAVGDVVDLSAVLVPEGLRGIPAFAALAGRSPAYRLGSDAELGALIALGQNGPLGADVLIRDAALTARMQAALDALGQQVQAAAPDAASAYAGWRKQGASAVAAPGEPISLATLGDKAVIVVDEQAGNQAANLFKAQWRDVALSKALTVRAASEPAQRDDTVLLSRFGAMTGTLDVLARSDRSIGFDIGAVATNGRLPVEALFNIAAAPNIAGEAPMASIFLNDYLIGSSILNADGKPQWLRGAIPRSLLAARNELKISVLRQPTQLRCHDQLMSYPVSILPGSYLRLGKGALTPDFIGIAAGFGAKHDVIVPATWLTDAPAQLKRLIRVADAAGLSVAQAQLQVVPAGQSARIDAPFLALDVPIPGSKPLTAVDNGRLIIRGNDKQPLLDLATLDGLAVAEVAESGGQAGIVYRTVGKQPPALKQPFRFTRGDVTVLGDDGPIVQLDSKQSAELDATRTNPKSLWERTPLLWRWILGGVVVLLLIAIVRRLRRKKPKQA